MANLRWKILTIVFVFIVFFSVGVYPLIGARYGVTWPRWLTSMALKRGLDLQGGVHLVLRVKADTPLKVETESEMERLRGLLSTRSVQTTNIELVSPTQFKVEGVASAQDAAFREAAAELDTNFNRTPGAGGTYTFTMKPNIEISERDEAVVQARQTIERRVNELGVAEPSIAQQGANGDEILVQLPGVTDVDRAKEIIRSTGLLELKIVEQGPSPTRESLLVNGQPPPGMDIVPGASAVPGDAAGAVYYVVRKAAAVTGRDVRNARPTVDENNQPAV